jgi:hypothetical protein
MITRYRIGNDEYYPPPIDASFVQQEAPGKKTAWDSQRNPDGKELIVSGNCLRCDPGVGIAVLSCPSDLGASQ